MGRQIENTKHNDNKTEHNCYIIQSHFFINNIFINLDFNILAKFTSTVK